MRIRFRNTLFTVLYIKTVCNNKYYNIIRPKYILRRLNLGIKFRSRDTKVGTGTQYSSFLELEKIQVPRVLNLINSGGCVHYFEQ